MHLRAIGLASALLTTTTFANTATGPLYDYVIVGGGTSGLVVANRLSEDPDVSVVVIEAGDSVYDNHAVTAASGYGKAFGSPIDYQYETVNQTHAGGPKQVLRAGKALGGTSTINGMSYTRAEDVQIDKWAELGNRDWSWEALFPFYIKSENLTRPTKHDLQAGATYNESVHGFEGPLHVSFNHYMEGNVTGPLNETFDNLGVPWSEDVNGGKMRGFSVFPETIDHEKDVREDAARAYYWPYKDRPNLTMMSSTRANRILWKKDSEVDGSDAVADGVEVNTSDGTSTVMARREVVLSAGSLRTPTVLELSGVGNKVLLENYNISSKVDLPAVGENLQDQTNAKMIAIGKSKFTGVKTMAYATFHDIFGDEAKAVADSVLGNLTDYAAATAKAINGVVNEDNIMSYYQAQYDLLFSSEVPMVEILFIPTHSPALVTEFWTLLPFSRGNVHISSSDPEAYPYINPNYFMLEWDQMAHVAVMKYIRKVYQTAPLKDMIMLEKEPGHALSKNATDDQWGDYAKSNYRSNFHPIGTAAMMPRAMGGVVSDRLLVHGTSNVRVVDASVLPLQMCGHLTSTLYAIAERASDFMKQDKDS